MHMHRLIRRDIPFIICVLQAKWGIGMVRRIGSNAVPAFLAALSPAPDSLVRARGLPGPLCSCLRVEAEIHQYFQ